ncbi:MAG TPA: arylsulfotransferase family protein [Thermoanaerobaculia bacterium]|nr:arylsulfotransferase family protein [Thermoanaerobaculia bacterium]
MKKLLVLLLALAALGAGFAWGFATDRYRVFPMSLIRSAAVVFGQRWNSVAVVKSTSPSLAALKSVPYLSGSVDADPSAMGVLVNEPDRVAPGLNFLSTLWAGDAFLVGNDGKVLWRWSLSRELSPVELRPGIAFGYTHLFPNGDVLAFVDGFGVVKLDKDSRLLWKRVALAHHDAFVADDGTIYALVHERRVVPTISDRHPLLVDDVEVLSPSGERLRVISLFDAIQGSPYAFLLPRTAGLVLEPGTDMVDVFHTNHVEVYDGKLAGLSPLFRRGNLLLSMRSLNAIAILDGATSEVLWLWGPTNLSLQHYPTILDNGNILLFDNGTSRSQVIEVDPRTNAVAWRYAPEKNFHSASRGACQRLSNGNTLITLSERGHALEVTSSGRTVWEYANPSVAPGGVREAIFQVTRLPSASLTFLGSSPARTRFQSPSKRAAIQSR